TVLGYFLAGENLAGLFIEVYKIATNPIFMAIPLFIFAGYTMAESKTPQRLVNLSRAMIGWLPGGIAVVALITCAFFTAFTGASGVTIIAMGGLLYPILLREKYGENFTLGILTTTGSLGLLFPPSLPLILYAVIAGNAYSSITGMPGVTVDKLFLAALIPGILLVVALSIYSIFVGNKIGVNKTKFDWKKLWVALKEAKYELPLPIIIIVGIYGGFFTASEGSAIAAIYVLIVEVFIYRDISIKKDLVRVIKDSCVLTGGLMVIIGMAMAFTNYLVEKEVPFMLVNIMKEHLASKISFLMILNVLLIIICMIDNFSAILVVVPLIIPVANSFGVNPLHLGVIFLINLEIGFLTPPIGLNVFISSYRFKKNILEIFRATLPFYIILVICLLLVTYIPWLTLCLQ
ncbi:MAG: TRAP transporter large permease, partial [Proteobacteria bacterium]|nr:TRAP transporter large permease [Pseudomonadota bacterium]